MKNLRKYNTLMGILHLLQGLLVLTLSNSFKLPINSSFVQYNIVTNRLMPVLNKVAELPIGPMVALFLFLSATAHFILCLPAIYPWYTRNLEKGINYARWYEYAFSASLMIILIALLVGIYDLGALILMFGLNAMMILLGLMMELHNQTTKKTNWTSYIFSCIAGIIPWIVIALYLFNAGDADHKAPTFVYWIFFTIFLFFNSFAINMYLQYKKVGKWKDYLWGEKMYILLSLIAKSALAWQVFAGTLRPV
ncbi:MAG: heliorhodopsin HeR [bacterium]